MMDDSINKHKIGLQEAFQLFHIPKFATWAVHAGHAAGPTVNWALNRVLICIIHMKCNKFQVLPESMKRKNKPTLFQCNVKTITL